MALYDHNGKPVNTGALTTEQSTGRLTSVRSPYEPIVAAGLTPRKLVALLARAKEGDHADYLTLASEMEQRDPHYYSVLDIRKNAVCELERTVEAPKGSQSDKAVEAVQDLVFSSGFGMALKDILDALGKGFSVCEIIWSRTSEIWRPAAFKYRPPRWYQFDRETAEELRLVDGTPDGEALEPFKYVIHVPHVFSGLPLAGGLARIVAALHVFKGYAVKDWMAFAEVFGMPIRIGTYPPGSSKQDKAELEAAVKAIGSDAAAIFPATMKIEFVRAQMSGAPGADEFFEKLARWLNEETSKAVIGQTMTSENGSSLAQAQVHNLVRKDIRNADAWQLANTIQRDIIRPFVDLNFGTRPRETDYPLFNFDTSEPEDLERLAKALPPFIDRGLPVSIAAVLEKFGLSLPEASEPILGAVGKVVSEGDDAQTTADKTNALLHRIIAEAEKHTNMRTFKRALKELTT